MKKACSNCPYFSLENLELLKEILKWTKALALSKDYNEKARETAITNELKKISRILSIRSQRKDNDNFNVIKDLSKLIHEIQDKNKEGNVSVGLLLLMANALTTVKMYEEKQRFENHNLPT
jgi:uncharacterized protein YjgD (DUF1641 family)